MRLAPRACATPPLRSPCHAQPVPISQWLLTTKSFSRFRSDNVSGKAHPFKGYLEDKLDAPLYSVRPQTRTQPKPPPPDELPKTEKEETLAKARVVFGSRLAGPGERRAEINKLSRNVAGVLVPPKPEEPDNCCMSGCVNCVWDRFRDELEEWAEKSTEARVKLQEQKANSQASGTPFHAGVSMDDDGGGSETNIGMETFVQGGTDLFADIPVGIREFMKTEKRLKEKRKREEAQGG